ncbi:energy transducer TonB [Lacinutrix algicola]|uniref:energy transducer TonB n=1 Tax=Lacinutrix algicola TaxID=342954 RepID=UPI0006E4451B|nr:energy transducer TonB [Lacinutrix algicola]
MNNSKKSHDFVRQNEINVQKSQKHDANLQKNSTLYFQVGLILCLLASYGALEMSFAETQEYVYSTPVEDDSIYEIDIENFEIEKEVKPEQKQEIAQVKPKDPEIKIVSNETKLKETLKEIIKVVVPEGKTPVLSTDDPSLKIDEIEPEITIMTVQKVPVFPGCEKESTNNGRRKCMSEKLSKLVQRKFDVDIASDLGITGKQKIYVSFKINKLGEVEIIKTKANHLALEKEANRVVGKIPTMKPGMNNNKPVNVSYMLPIQFNIQ